jgi:hypothetical protein
MNFGTKRAGFLAAALVGTAAALALLPGTMSHVARADSTGTPISVSAANCILNHGGNVTVPAGSTIVIHQRIGEQTLGIMQNFLNAQTTTTSVNDGQMSDVSSNWGAPFDLNGFSFADVDVPSSVTLSQAGDQMRFTFALLLSTKVPEILNPAVGGQPGQPTYNGPGLNFGGTCTVTAT